MLCLCLLCCLLCDLRFALCVFVFWLMLCLLLLVCLLLFKAFVGGLVLSDGRLL